MEIKFVGKVNEVGVLRGTFIIPAELAGWLKPADIHQFQQPDLACWEPGKTPEPWQRDSEIVFDANSLSKAEEARAGILSLIKEAHRLYVKSLRNQRIERDRIASLRDVWEEEEEIVVLDD